MLRLSEEQEKCSYNCKHLVINDDDAVYFSSITAIIGSHNCVYLWIPSYRISTTVVNIMRRLRCSCLL